MAGEMKDCYGKMFPPMTRCSHNIGMTGKVLSYCIAHPGIMATGPSISIDEEAWRRCLKCQEYESCCRLSISKLLLEIALAA